MEGLVLTFLLLYCIINLCILCCNLIVLAVVVKLYSEILKIRELTRR